MLTTVGGSAGPGLAQATVVTPFSTESLATSVPGAPCSAAPVRRCDRWESARGRRAASEPAPVPDVLHLPLSPPDLESYDALVAVAP